MTQPQFREISFPTVTYEQGVEDFLPNEQLLIDHVTCGLLLSEAGMNSQNIPKLDINLRITPPKTITAKSDRYYWLNRSWGGTYDYDTNTIDLSLPRIAALDKEQRADHPDKPEQTALVASHILLYHLAYAVGKDLGKLTEPPAPWKVRTLIGATLGGVALGSGFGAYELSNSNAETTALSVAAALYLASHGLHWAAKKYEDPGLTKVPKKDNTFAVDFQQQWQDRFTHLAFTSPKE